MIFKWESEKERLLKHMKMSPKSKLEWLRQINEFNAKYLPKRSKLARQKLKEKGY
ncbi:MAG: hypothetical protein ISS34_07655 [Candidatus Omnitrophica bacterium]|nr:hypothetical protein [Candidatus Omnitrophota bacterium]